MNKGDWDIDTREVRFHPQVYVAIKSRAIESWKVALTETEREYGDYAFQFAGGLATIELCSVSDFVGKLNSGRLERQMVGMLKTSQVRVLMIQGDFKADPAGNVAIHGAETRTNFNRAVMALHSIKAHQIMVEHTRNLDDSIARIIAIYQWWQKPMDKHEFMRDAGEEGEEAPTIPLLGGIERPVSALGSLVRGLGESRAVTALEALGDFKTVVSVPAGVLKNLPGWGPKLANDVHEAANRRYPRS